MVTASQSAASQRPLLIHAHPGHELRLYGWMEMHKPTLFLMTDGSGSGATRTHYSRETASSAGALAGAIFGLAADSDWYAAILRADRSLFERVVDALVQSAIAQGSTLIVSDAVDGYNPMHDLCEVVAASAASRLRARGHNVAHLVARAASGGDEADIVAIMQLDREALRRKQAAVDAYTPLAEEVRRLLGEEPSALSVEQLRRPAFTWPTDCSPSWEDVGASRVAASKYVQRIEYARHVRPLALALLGSQALAGKAERLDCAS